MNFRRFVFLRMVLIVLTASVVAGCAGTALPTQTPTADVIEVPLSQRNLVKQLVALGQFRELLRLLDASGLQGDLQQQGPYTLIAPLDSAFGQLPEGTVNQLLAEPAVLRELLSGHVIMGEYTLEELASMSPVEAMDGSQVEVRYMEGYYYVNDVQVVLEDQEADNGTLQVVGSLINVPQDGAE